MEELLYKTITTRDIMPDVELTNLVKDHWVLQSVTFNNCFIYIFRKELPILKFTDLAEEGADRTGLFMLQPPEQQPKRFMFKTALLSLGVSQQTAADWIKVRQAKKAAQTETAFNIIKREVSAVCENYGVTADDVIKVAVDRNWQGVKAAWFDNVDWSFYGIEVGHTDLPFGSNQNWE